MDKLKKLSTESWLLLGLSFVIILTVGFVGVLSFALSYDTLWSMAILGGKQANLAWAWPLIIDIPILAFSLVALFFTILGVKTELARFAVLAVTLLTIGFNYRYAVEAGISWQVVVIAPLMYAASFEFLVIVFRQSTKRVVVVKTTETLADELANLQANFEQQKANFEAELAKSGDKISQQADKLKADFEQQKANFESEVAKFGAEIEALLVKKEQLGADIEAKKSELGGLRIAASRVYFPTNVGQFGKEVEKAIRQNLVGQMSDDGLKNNEIAERLNVSLSTVKLDKTSTNGR